MAEANLARPMPDELLLREKAREAIRNGNVPIAKPGRTWGGPGTGEACAVCGEPVRRSDLGFELEFQPETAKYHFHIRCLAAWEFERTKVPGSSL